MLLAITVPVVILAVGAAIAYRGHSYNRQLTLGLAIILAVLGLAAVLVRNAGVLK